MKNKNFLKFSQKIFSKIPWLLIIINLIFIDCGFLKVKAQTPTPKATESAEISNEEIKEKIQERIEQVKKESKKRAFWGILKEITNSTLILTNDSRGEKIIKTGINTQFLKTGGKEIKITDLEIGNFIIALGYWQENGTLEGKKIISSTETPKAALRRYAIYGKISDISKEEKVLSVIHPIKSEIVYEVKITEKTIITEKTEEEKIKKVDFTKLAIDKRIVAVGTREKGSGTLTAKIIHIIPEKTNLPEKNTPTPESKTPTP